MSIWPVHILGLFLSRCQACGAGQPVHMCVNGCVAASYQPAVFNYQVGIPGVFYGPGDCNQMIPMMSSQTQDPNSQANAHFSASENTGGVVHAVQGTAPDMSPVQTHQAPETQVFQTQSEYELLKTTDLVSQNQTSPDLAYNSRQRQPKGNEHQKDISDEGLHKVDVSESSITVLSGPDIRIHRDRGPYLSSHSSQTSDDSQGTSPQIEIPGISTSTKPIKDVSEVSVEATKQKPAKAKSHPTSDPILNSWFKVVDDNPFMGLS